MGNSKRPRVLTRDEKIAVSAYNLNPKDYLYLEKITDSYFSIVHKDNGTHKTIDKYARPKRR